MSRRLPAGLPGRAFTIKYPLGCPPRILQHCPSTLELTPASPSIRSPSIKAMTGPHLAAQKPHMNAAPSSVLATVALTVIRTKTGTSPARTAMIPRSRRMPSASTRPFISISEKNTRPGCLSTVDAEEVVAEEVVTAEAEDKDPVDRQSIISNCPPMIKRRSASKSLPPRHQLTLPLFSCSPRNQFKGKCLPPPKCLLAASFPSKSTRTSPTLSFSLDPSLAGPTAQASRPSLIQRPPSPPGIFTSLSRLRRHFPTWWQPCMLQRITLRSP
jgi:hypothetical protein